MKTYTFHATGMQHYSEAIEPLRYENDDYTLSKSELAELHGNGKVWKYEYSYSKLELIPEPQNEFDKNAVAVYADGKKIAHIKKGSCSQVKNLLASGNVNGIDADIGGGPYKYIDEDEDGKVTVDKDEAPLFVHITIYVDNGEPDRKAPAEPAQAAPAPSVPEKKKRSAWKKIIRVFSVLFILFGALMVFIDPICVGFIILGIVLFITSK